MKNKNSKLRLKLNKETISNLDNVHMNSVYGGDGGDLSIIGKICDVGKTILDITCFGSKCEGNTNKLTVKC